jgi:hypothetical protein
VPVDEALGILAEIVVRVDCPLQQLVRYLLRNIARPTTPADRGSWGAPEYVTVASIRGHPDRLPVDEDVVEGIVPTVVVGPFRCDLWPICHSKP